MKTNYSSKIFEFLLPALLLLCHIQGGAASYFAIANGNWNTSGTWSATAGGPSCSCTPQSGDEITIPTGFNVTIPNGITITLASGNLHITGGTLSFGNNSSNLNLGSGSVINITAGGINPPNNGSEVFIQFGTTCTTAPCQYTGGEINTLTAPTNLPYQLNASGGASLPVELAKFRAILSASKALLNWETASEQDNLGFHVERSADGMKWESLGFVQGMGTSLEPHHYGFTDETPLRSLNYYRLAQEDFDGDVDYSRVLSLSLGEPVPFSVFPNPAGNELQVVFDNASGAAATVGVYDVFGRLALSRALEDAVTTVSLEGVATGTYLVVMEQEGHRWVRKLLVK